MWSLSIACRHRAQLMIYTWKRSVGPWWCRGCRGWEELPLSFTAMQCTPSIYFSASHSVRSSVDSSFGTTCTVVVIIKENPQEKNSFSFFLLYYLFRIAYSQFIHSTVIIVVALQTRGVRQCSSPGTRSCVKVHNKQNSSLSSVKCICKYNIDICISLNRHLSQT